MLTRIFTAVLLTCAAATAGEGRISLLDGNIHRNLEIRSITEETLTYRDRGGRSHSVSFEEVVGFSHPREAPAVPGYEPQEVSVLLRGGDILLGDLVAGGDEQVVVDSPLLGKLTLSVDDVSEIRFLAAWTSATEKPPATEEDDLDVLVYDHLDTLSCTFLQATGNKILVHGEIGERHPIAYENLLAIRFADLGGAKKPEGRRIVMRLSDGSRVTVASLSSDGTRVRAKTIRGERVEFPLKKVAAFFQSGGRFRFLSDLKAKEEKIVPWIGETYAWDHARYDLSFLDRPIRSGGVVYFKGMGVVSGTSLTWAIEPGFSKFSCLIALDDEAGPEGDVVFEVLLDGKSVFKSDTVRTIEEPSRPIRVPFIDVSGAGRITLRVHYVDDFVRDYANWIEPMLIR